MRQKEIPATVKDYFLIAKKLGFFIPTASLW